MLIHCGIRAPDLYSKTGRLDIRFRTKVSAIIIKPTAKHGRASAQLPIPAARITISSLSVIILLYTKEWIDTAQLEQHDQKKGICRLAMVGRLKNWSRFSVQSMMRSDC